MVVDEIVDERALRELYLEGFRYAVCEGKPKTIMSAYNRVNGVYANENTYLLQDILCGEWGFDGVVVTDWGGENDRVAGLIAGNQLEMPFSAGLTDTTFSHDQIPYRVMRSLDYLQRERMRQRRNHSGLCEQTWQCGVSCEYSVLPAA